MHVKETQDKFMAAYDNYADAMFRHCYLRVSNREDARDLTQEAFMRTWDYMQKGKVITNFKAFLFTALNHLIVDWYRKKKPVPLSDEQAMLIPNVHHSKDPSVETEGRMALELLENLDEKTKSMVVLRLIEGWSPREIAELCHESENSVSVRIHRGINLLQKLINNQSHVK